MTGGEETVKQPYVGQRVKEVRWYEVVRANLFVFLSCLLNPRGLSIHSCKSEAYYVRNTRIGE